MAGVNEKPILPASGREFVGKMVICAAVAFGLCMKIPVLNIQAHRQAAPRKASGSGLFFN